MRWTAHTGSTIPRADGQGRVVAAEIMRVTGTIRDCIMDAERVSEIHDLIAEGAEQYGTQTFDLHLMELVRSLLHLALRHPHIPRHLTHLGRGLG